jgi:hypothetical protein
MCAVVCRDVDPVYLRYTTLLDLIDHVAGYKCKTPEFSYSELVDDISIKRKTLQKLYLQF